MSLFDKVKLYTVKGKDILVEKSKTTVRATVKGARTFGREFKEGYKEGCCEAARKTLAKYESEPVSKEEQAMLLEELKKAGLCLRK